MNKNTRTAFRLIASLLAALALVSLIACQEPVLVARKKADDQTTTTDEPAPITSAPATGLPSFTLSYDGKNASLSPFTTLAPSARSLGGYDRLGIIDLDGTTLSYFQWVFMDVAKDGDIYAYDDASGTDSQNMDLNAAVEPGQTYHVLLLAGYKPNAATDPTLLASAYTRFTATGAGSTLNLTLIPVVVDVKLTGGSDGARQPGRLAKTVGLDKEQSYTLEYFIGSNNKGVMATDDALKQAANDGLWPLKLASVEVRNTDTWLYKYSQKNTGTGVQETLTSYQTGVLDNVEVPLNNAFGTNLAWVQWQGGSKEGLNDLNVNKSLATTGRGKYGLETPRTALTEGTVWFHLEYVPFAIFNDAMWDTVSGGRVTERPVWVIRNGLTDDKQVATTWTSGMAYAGTEGGIAIGVVDPAAPFLAGLFEDNNPWPIDTGGKTSVEIQTWLNNSPITTVKTIAGIKGEGQGKYGNYTLLPRRYYAAPVTGKQPLGGITGIAANGGASWQDASSNIQNLVTLAAANVALAALPVDIWAAAGTYTAASGTGTVIDISGGTDYLSIYGGFKGVESAAIGSLPTGRASWFNSYTTLAIGNKYGTVTDSARKTTINAGGSGTAVKVANAANFVLDGFTITGGVDGGLLIDNAPATALFANMELTGNATTSAGGGIRVGGGAPHLDKLTITNNTSTDDWGGGICLDNSAALVTNIHVSGNEVINEAGGGIAIVGASPRLENIVVTGNRSTTNGGGIYLHGTPVIVNALVIGNTCEVNGIAPSGYINAYGLGGGGIYVGIAQAAAPATAILVNALVSGNRMTVSVPPPQDEDLVGGGGIKVSDTGSLTLINSTVSGNYAFYSGNTSPRGGGIMLIRNPAAGSPSTLNLYNSLVLGNTGQGGDDDLTVIDSTYTASNSLVGGWSKADMDATGGGDNADGASYGAAALALAQFKVFFTAFDALPTTANTGNTGYDATRWNFRLNTPPPGVVDGGDAAHYGLVSGGVSTDVAGSSRAQGGAPDMGAYESTLIGVPIPTYTVTNAKPQGTSSYGYLTVSSATAQAGVEVTITATLTTGYVGTVTCRTAGGATVPVTTIDSTHGKFTMPAEHVTVDATFTTSSVGGQTGFGS